MLFNNENFNVFVPTMQTSQPGGQSGQQVQHMDHSDQSWRKRANDIRLSLRNKLKEALASQNYPNAGCVAESYESEVFTSANNLNEYKSKFVLWLASIYERSNSFAGMDFKPMGSPGFVKGAGVMRVVNIKNSVNLPNEIWCMIFSYLPLAPKKNATATCKLWYRIIRENPKFSGHILVSWYNMKTALETLQWNWLNWPGLKILELNKLELVEDSRVSVQNVIEKLSLKDHCPPSLESVLFDVDLTPIQSNGQSLLLYQPYTNQIFGLGQRLDSIQKWNEYESNLRALKMLKSFRYMSGRNKGAWRQLEGPLPPHMFRPILEELEATPVPSNDALLLIASPAFQTFRSLCDRVMNYLESWPEGRFSVGLGGWSQFLGLRVNNDALRYWNKLVAKYGD